MGLTAHGTWKFKTPMSEGIHHAMNPDPYKGLFGGCRDSPVQVSGRCDIPGDVCPSTADYMNQFEEVVKYSLPKGLYSFLECILAIVLILPAYELQDNNE